MTGKEFYFFRTALRKTQKQMAEILGISLKAIQSFEQGWRKVPGHVERHVLFLLSMKYKAPKPLSPCWDMRECSTREKEVCPAWEFKSDYPCWFVNGTICHGSAHGSWRQKMNLCGSCKVFTSFMKFSDCPSAPKQT
jgi:putative transcriptional regulator